MKNNFFVKIGHIPYMEEKIEIKNLIPSMLEEIVLKMGLPRYRTDQLVNWIYAKWVADWDVMTNLSKELRAQLAQTFLHQILIPQEILVSRDGTRKFLFRLKDGFTIESVLIPDKDRRTLCISSQVGCALKCAFCYTGAIGFKRNLETWEIIEQVLAVKRALPLEEHPTNIVFMGMGEPLLNYENVIRAVEILNLDSGLKFSHRRMTISTAGIITAIEKLARDQAPVSLALSLNAPDDKIRSVIMPINKTYPLDEVLKTLEKFPLSNRKRITFEYVMLKDVNDTPLHARQLANKIKRFPCKVNLIPFNPFPGTSFSASPPAAVEGFQKILREKHISAFIRKSRGADILAACGQLAGKVSISAKSY